MEGNTLAEGLKALARDEAARPGGRARIVAALREVLLELEGRSGVRIAAEPDEQASTETTPDPFVTLGTARALRGIADGLAQAAEAAGHVADHAQVILPPRAPAARR